MILELGDYKITTDSLQYIVKRKSTVKNKESKNYGKETEVTVGYYSNLQSALYAIPQNIVRSNNDINLILTKIENIERIADQIKVIKINEVSDNEIVIKKEEHKKLEDYNNKELKEPTKEEIELGKKICEEFGTEDINDGNHDIVIDGVKYAFNEIQEWQWDDEGKYQNGDCVIQAGIADKECPWNIEEGKELNIFIMQEATRSGSYFSDYWYEYEKPYLVRKDTVKKEIWVSL